MRSNSSLCISLRCSPNHKRSATPTCASFHSSGGPHASHSPQHSPVTRSPESASTPFGSSGFKRNFATIVIVSCSSARYGDSEVVDTLIWFVSSTTSSPSPSVSMQLSSDELLVICSAAGCRLVGLYPFLKRRLGNPLRCPLRLEALQPSSDEMLVVCSAAAGRFAGMYPFLNLTPGTPGRCLLRVEELTSGSYITQHASQTSTFSISTWCATKHTMERARNLPCATHSF